MRKEIRTLTPEEHSNFNRALKALKVRCYVESDFRSVLQTDEIDGIAKYDILVGLHHPALSPGAHVGAAYLPWHREYLRM